MPSGSGDQLVIDELGDVDVEVTDYDYTGQRSSLPTLPPTRPL